VPMVISGGRPALGPRIAAMRRKIAARAPLPPGMAMLLVGGPPPGRRWRRCAGRSRRCTGRSRRGRRTRYAALDWWRPALGPMAVPVVVGRGQKGIGPFTHRPDIRTHTCSCHAAHGALPRGRRPYTGRAQRNPTIVIARGGARGLVGFRRWRASTRPTNLGGGPRAVRVGRVERSETRQKTAPARATTRDSAATSAGITRFVGFRRWRASTRPTSPSSRRGVVCSRRVLALAPLYLTYGPDGVSASALRAPSAQG
jgi:hypothetical protein